MPTDPDGCDRSEARFDREGFAARVTAATGLDEVLIERLVHAFYERVRADTVLGPVFAARITDWGPHLERMCAFWSSVLLMSGRYHGRPMQAHARLPVSGAMFDRWLALFEKTAHEICQPAGARLVIEKARMIATSLEQGVGIARGLALAPGSRLPAPGEAVASTACGRPRPA